MMGRKVAGSIVAFVLSAGVFAAAPAGASTCTDEASFVRMLNAERTSRGLAALQVRSDLTAYARRHSAKMASARTIFHSTSSSLGSIDGWSEIGENVGTGPTVGDIHRAFMASSSHRRNILYSRYNQVGIGVAIAEGKI